MPSSTNTRNNLEAQLNLEAERIRRERERRAARQTQAQAEEWEPTTRLQKVAYIALTELLLSQSQSQSQGQPEDQHLKNLVIDFLVEPGVPNEKKQKEIAALHQALLAKFGPFTWVPMIYRNSFSGKYYIPHHREEANFVYSDGPWINGLIKGGEGSGKSAGGVVKDLERLRRRMDGILTSPDLPHFKKSLWPEFKRWCPWDQVVTDQQRRGKTEWEPDEPFTLTFKNKAQAICGGMDNPGAWEGPNVSWAHLDEARRKKDASALKVLAGRIRIPGLHGELPQMYFTTTPRKNWLHEYFGEWDKPDEPDPQAEFKANSSVVKLKTVENEINTYVGYTRNRGSGLSEAEKRVLLEAEWEDIDDVERFLPSIILWDACLDETLPPLDMHQPMVLSADAGVNNDCFALTGVTRHPGEGRSDELAVRYSRVWVPRNKRALDFDDIEREIVEVCERFNVIILCYDKYQLHQMMTRLKRENVVTTREFSQQTDRAIADKQLLDLIVKRMIWHDGTHTELRKHLDNADRKIVGEDRAIRLVKREDSLKIDLAVSTSMAAAQCLRLNLW